MKKLGFVFVLLLSIFAVNIGVANSQIETAKSEPNPNYLIKQTIAYVIDGDTVKIRLKERNTSVRLTGIDAMKHLTTIT